MGQKVFMEVIIPVETLEGTFSRASSGTYFNSVGTLTTVGNNVVRVNYDPINLDYPPAVLIENAATNQVLNSATLVTQNITVTNTTHTLSFYGTGNVTLSGAHTAVVVGVGVSPQITSYTFTPAAGTLTLTVAGSCTWGQLETGSYATSYIATAATPVVRAADVATTGLLYSSVPETDYPVWLVGTSYTIGDRVIYNHRKYESLRVSNTGHNPETDTTQPPYWEDIAPTNRYAMFDQSVGVGTTQATKITVVIKAGVASGMGFVELDADQVQISLTSGGKTVYSRTINTSAEPVADWWEYFTSDIVRLSEYVATDIPAYLGGVITAVFTVATGDVSVGEMINGKVLYIGSTEAGASPGIISYDVKTTNAFGITKVTPRPNSKRMNIRVLIEGASKLDSVVKSLATLISTPCLWIGAGNSFRSLIVYGFLRDFDPDIAYSHISYCSIQIEGLI
jgi:hypothetical protein